jgi:hypothetical protein
LERTLRIVESAEKTLAALKGELAQAKTLDRSENLADNEATPKEQKQ